MRLERVIKQVNKDFESTDPEKKTYPTLEAQHVDITRLPQTGFELFGRQEELTLLNEAWESDATNIISFVAYGGVGKSTLINKWVEKMRWDNYRDAEKIYAWSFYSQGTKEQVISADMFISNALEWFGDADPSLGSPWDKGKRLSRLINNHKTLLILDGLEPLQAADKVEKGKIKDPALETLIKELVKKSKGLCVITTREHVPELDRYTKKAKQENLEHISDVAGRKLLEMRRIFGSEKELERMVQQFGNHALAINLLAEYLRMFENHPLEKADSISDLDIPDKQGKHACRIIEAFANHFGSASAEYQLLSILGFFDRPVPIDAIDAIIRDNTISGLFDKIIDTSGSDWLTTLEKLRRHKLLFEKSEHRPDTIDCHPLIREHFGGKLKQRNPDGWKQVHARLYEYYRDLPKKELPDTLEEMEPLFAAVMHGCLAGKHQEAMDDIYSKKIRRRGEAYLEHKLGAFGVILSCLFFFFEKPWSKPFYGLNDDVKAAVLSWSGFALRAVGELSRAIQPTKTALEMRIEQSNYLEVARIASNLSELYLTLGDVASAQKYCEQCVIIADSRWEWVQKMINRTTFADALHQEGKIKVAEKLFIEAENIQKKNQPEYPWLCSLPGFRFCDLVLSMGKYQPVLEMVRCVIKIQTTTPVADFGFNNLSIGKALMMQVIDNNSSDFIESDDYLNQSINSSEKLVIGMNYLVLYLPVQLFPGIKKIFTNPGTILMRPGKLQNMGR
ncbi:MAG: ATP-binding protein [Candidatus Scalindua rubra]|nr:ATP-binding protein [Candidatus Scalindua rubra]TWU38090.1 hypothetical protein S225a_01370 [Candidatus Brocadiaceae bacterium S225]